MQVSDWLICYPSIDIIIIIIIVTVNDSRPSLHVCVNNCYLDN